MKKHRKKLDESVLPVEQFIAWRQEGLTFAEIGRRIGYADSTVSTYGKRVLPEELQGRRRHGKPKKRPQPKQRCARCELAGEPKRPINPDTGLCLWCEKETNGESLRDYYESGQAAAELGTPTPAGKKAAIKAELRRAAGLIKAGEPPAPVPVPAAPEVAVARYLPDYHHQIDRAAWLTFLIFASNPEDLSPLANLVPPAYVRSDADRWIYLQQLAIGRVRGAGWIVRRRLRRVLAQAGHPVPGPAAVARELLATLRAALVDAWDALDIQERIRTWEYVISHPEIVERGV